MLARTFEYLERLVAFETTPPNSNRDPIDRISPLLARHRAQMQRTSSDSRTKSSLLASFGPASVRGVVWSAQIDAAHKPDEHIEIPQLIAAGAFLPRVADWAIS